MPEYRRAWMPGGTFFFTLVTWQRNAVLCDDPVRCALREAINRVRVNRPFHIDAWVLLPDHLHCIWTLPDGDADFATRWRLIKSITTNRSSGSARVDTQDTSRHKRKEQYLWQRRYWEHRIRDADDFARHCDYIHYNPVKHGLCAAVNQWPYSTFHHFVKHGIYVPDWGGDMPVNLPDHIGHE